MANLWTTCRDTNKVNPTGYPPQNIYFTPNSRLSFRIIDLNEVFAELDLHYSCEIPANLKDDVEETDISQWDSQLTVTNGCSLLMSNDVADST